MNFEGIQLCKGTHEDIGRTGRGCLMNVISFISGDNCISDAPACVHPQIRGIGIWLNDQMDDAPRQELVKFIPRMMLSSLLSGRELMFQMREHLTEFWYEQRRFMRPIGARDGDTPIDIAVNFAGQQGVPSRIMEGVLVSFLDKVLTKVNENYTVEPLVQIRFNELVELGKLDMPQTVGGCSCLSCQMAFSIFESMSVYVSPLMYKEPKVKYEAQYLSDMQMQMKMLYQQAKAQIKKYQDSYFPTFKEYMGGALSTA